MIEIILITLFLIAYGAFWWKIGRLQDFEFYGDRLVDEAEGNYVDVYLDVPQAYREKHMDHPVVKKCMSRNEVEKVRSQLADLRTNTILASNGIFSYKKKRQDMRGSEDGKD